MGLQRRGNFAGKLAKTDMKISTTARVQIGIALTVKQHAIVAPFKGYQEKTIIFSWGYFNANFDEAEEKFIGKMRF